MSHNMEYSELNISNLKDIIKQTEEIQGQWNGDEAGKQEDRANIAFDIALHCKMAIDLIEELKN